MKRILCCLILFSATSTIAQEIKFPLKASADKKYIVDQNNSPVFLNGCSVWNLPFAVSYPEAKDYLIKLKTKKFNTVLIKFSPDTNTVGNRLDEPIYNNRSMV